MPNVRTCEDVDEGRRLWQSNWPKTCLFDLWQVRAFFQKHYNNTPYFLVAEQNKKTTGLLALSWLEESNCFAHFPGETWQGKTWLEQNKVVASDPVTYQALLDHIQGPACLRYMTRDSILLDEGQFGLDETGYIFHPNSCSYSFQHYMQQFSGKSRKQLGREVDRLKSLGHAFRHDHFKDIDQMFEMSLNAFGSRSYFNDRRFLNAFEELLSWLQQKGMLRITTVLLGGEVAAVDVGALFGASYTILAGGTNPDFPGVAKLINFHHIERACIEQFKDVDFLCGDFGWKERFHLTPRPLYEINLHQETHIWQDLFEEKSLGNAQL